MYFKIKCFSSFFFIIYLNLIKTFDSTIMFKLCEKCIDLEYQLVMTNKLVKLDSPKCNAQNFIDSFQSTFFLFVCVSVSISEIHSLLPFTENKNHILFVLIIKVKSMKLISSVAVHTILVAVHTLQLAENRE